MTATAIAHLRTIQIQIGPRHHRRQPLPDDPAKPSTPSTAPAEVHGGAELADGLPRPEQAEVTPPQRAPGAADGR
jgi:hypothetical protein